MVRLSLVTDIARVLPDAGHNSFVLAEIHGVKCSNLSRWIPAGFGVPADAALSAIAKQLNLSAVSPVAVVEALTAAFVVCNHH
jgi:hypothetical protein